MEVILGKFKKKASRLFPEPKELNPEERGVVSLADI